MQAAQVDDPMRVTMAPVIGTASGGSFSPLNPRVQDVRVEDIAHALSHICRYTGHTSEFYSVASHSIAMSDILYQEDPTDLDGALAALFHDASEAYLVDVPKPLKPWFPEYEMREAEIERVIALALLLPYPLPARVKKLDRDIVVAEVAQFFPRGSFLHQRYGLDVPPCFQGKIRSYGPEEGRDVFLARYQHLTWRRGQRLAQAGAGR
jgi:hypothetical protein